MRRTVVREMGTSGFAVGQHFCSLIAARVLVVFGPSGGVGQWLQKCCVEASFGMAEL